jgi:hypothetical protein
MWNLLKISWREARAQTGFREADAIRVAVEVLPGVPAITWGGNRIDP